MQYKDGVDIPAMQSALASGLQTWGRLPRVVCTLNVNALPSCALTRTVSQSFNMHLQPCCAEAQALRCMSAEADGLPGAGTMQT